MLILESTVLIHSPLARVNSVSVALHHLILTESSSLILRSPNLPQIPSWTPPPPPQPQPQPQPPSPLAVAKDAKPANQGQPSLHKNEVAGVSSSSPKIESAPPLLRKLLDCARLAESKPDRAVKTLIALRKSVSEHGDPTEQVDYYFSEALYTRLLVQAEKSMTMVQTTSEDFILTYKALNDACPLPEIKTEESLGFQKGNTFLNFF